jgi:tripartite-type tricarboxylate transporter receptor subunit TctC
MLSRRVFLASIAFTAFAGRAAAGEWPQRPVRVIYPYVAGSSGDVGARMLAEKLGEAFGQSFVVENRVGANGTLAAQAVARAAPDGYTIFSAAIPQIAIAPAMGKVPYDPVKDFAPISAFLTNSLVLVVNRQMPVTSVAEFIAHVRARPGQLVYAHGGVGSVSHLSMAIFLKRAGLEMGAVAYQGTPPALNDVVAGHVPAAFTLLGDALAHAANGSIRLLAVSTEKRAPQVPEIPTVGESGFPGYRAVTWVGLLAPAGTPKPIIEQIAAAVGAIVREQKFADRLRSMGADPLGNGPEEFAAMIAADTALWAQGVKVAGVGREP